MPLADPKATRLGTRVQRPKDPRGTMMASPVPTFARAEPHARERRSFTTLYWTTNVGTVDDRMPRLLADVYEQPGGTQMSKRMLTYRQNRMWTVPALETTARRLGTSLRVDGLPEMFDEMICSYERDAGFTASEGEIS